MKEIEDDIKLYNINKKDILFIFEYLSELINQEITKLVVGEYVFM